MESGHATGFFLDWHGFSVARWYFVFDDQYYYVSNTWGLDGTSNYGSYSAYHKWGEMASLDPSSNGLKPLYPDDPSKRFPTGVYPMAKIATNTLTKEAWVVPWIRSGGIYQYPTGNTYDFYAERYWNAGGSAPEYASVYSYQEPRTDTLVRGPLYSSSVSHKVTYWLGFAPEYGYVRNLYANHKVKGPKQGYFPPLPPATVGADFRYAPPYSSKITIESISYGSGYNGPPISNPGTIFLDSSYSTVTAAGGVNFYYSITAGNLLVGLNAINDTAKRRLSPTTLYLTVYCTSPAGYIKTSPTTGYATDTLPYKMAIDLSGYSQSAVINPSSGIVRNTGYTIYNNAASQYEERYSGWDYDMYRWSPTFTVDRRVGSGFTESFLRVYLGATASDSTGKNNYLQLNNVKYEIIDLVYDDPAFSPYFGNP